MTPNIFKCQLCSHTYATKVPLLGQKANTHKKVVDDKMIMDKVDTKSVALDDICRNSSSADDPPSPKAFDPTESGMEDLRKTFFPSMCLLCS